MSDHKRILVDAPSEMIVLAARHLDATEGPVRVGSAVTTTTRSAITTVLGYIAKAHNSSRDTAGQDHSEEAQPMSGPSPAAEALLAAFDELQLAEMLAAASARVRRVRELHRDEYGSCSECTHVMPVQYPCPTICALDGQTS
mgnify:FL=1